MVPSTQLPIVGEGASELAAVVRELAGIVADRRQAEDDEDGPVGVVFARDPAAFDELRSRHLLPRVYAEFLREHSSHDFVASGLVCAGEAAWIAPVDNVAELTRCCRGEGAAPVCAVSGRGHYVLDLARARGGDCPVLHVDVDGAAREVAGSFVGFLRRVARESTPGHVVRDMPQEAHESGALRRSVSGWLAVVAAVVIALIVYGAARAL